MIGWATSLARCARSVGRGAAHLVAQAAPPAPSLPLGGSPAARRRAPSVWGGCAALRATPTPPCLRGVFVGGYPWRRVLWVFVRGFCISVPCVCSSLARCARSVGRGAAHLVIRPQPTPHRGACRHSCALRAWAGGKPRTRNHSHKRARCARAGFSLHEEKLYFMGARGVIPR